MKLAKLLDRLNRLMGLGEDADKEEIRKLRKVLKALKEKQFKVEKKLEQAAGEHERRKLQQQLEVIQHQRKKGVELYQTLKQSKASTPE